jgi:hypothetical protein
METVEFGDAEVLDEAVAGLVCRIATKRVTVPKVLLQSGTAVRRPGDHGTLVIPRWLGIGLGLVWPFSDASARVHALPAPAERKRRPPRRAARLDRGVSGKRGVSA